jgi:Lon protease-like protein
MFPLSSVLFPHADLPLHVFEPRYRTLTDHCLAGDGEFGVVLISRGSEVGGGDERLGVGTIARIEGAVRLEDGRFMLHAIGEKRIRVRSWLDDDPYPLAMVEELPAAGAPPDAGRPALATAEAAVRRVRGFYAELGGAPPLPTEMSDGGDEEVSGWRLCAQAPFGPLDKQRLLETEDLLARLSLLTTMADELAEDLSRLLALGGR